MDAADAAIEAARSRFRPILMTAASFVLGVLPLVLAWPRSGWSAVGIYAYFRGMLLASSIGIILVPLFFITAARFVKKQQTPASKVVEEQVDA